MGTCIANQGVSPLQGAFRSVIQSSSEIVAEFEWLPIRMSALRKIIHLLREGTMIIMRLQQMEYL